MPKRPLLLRTTGGRPVMTKTACQRREVHWSIASRSGRASPIGCGSCACSSCCSRGCRSSTPIRRSISGSNRASSSTMPCCGSGRSIPRGPARPDHDPGPDLRHDRRPWAQRLGGKPAYTAFPGAVTIPSYRDLATGRVVHFFFGWIFVATIFVWFLASLLNGHLRRDIVPAGADLKGLPGDALDHARLRLKHGRRYGRCRSSPISPSSRCCSR